jgi:hypothetical protein
MERDSKIQRVVHTFQTSYAVSNAGGRFNFEFREPVHNIVGARVKGCIIRNFSSIGSSQTYYLKTDCIFGSRDTSYFNTKPNQIAMVIPYNPAIAGQPIYRLDDSDGFIHCYPRFLQNCWFELYNDIGTIQNPADAGWYFTVELEFLICTK